MKFKSLKMAAVLPTLLVLAVAGGCAAYAQTAKSSQELASDDFMAIDLNKNGEITREEWDFHSAEVFASIDKNGNGQIELSEWEAYQALRQDRQKAGNK